MGGATLGLCIAAGALLARFTALDPPRRSRSGQVAASPLVGGAKDWLLTLGIAVGGVTLSSLARMSAGTLLMPMILAAVVVLAVPGGEFVAPQLVAQMAFALIGLQVGLSFTMDTVRLLGRLLVPVLTSIVGLLVACFGLAALLHLTSSVTLLDAYLATTPGGLFAVLAVAFGAGANTTFILAAQGHANPRDGAARAARGAPDHPRPAHHGGGAIYVRAFAASTSCVVETSCCLMYSGRTRIDG